MNLQDLVTDAMWALKDSWLSRTTPRFFAVGADATVSLSMEMVSNCDLFPGKRSGFHFLPLVNPTFL